MGWSSISEAADLMGFSHAAISVDLFSKRRKHQVNESFLGKDDVFMSEVREERPDFFVLIGRQQLLQ